ERPVAPRHSDTKRYRLGLDRDRSGRVALGRRRRGHDERRKPEHQSGHELPGTHGSTLPVVIQVLLPSCCSHLRPDAEMVPPPRDGGHWALGLRTTRPGDEKNCAELTGSRPITPIRVVGADRIRVIRWDGLAVPDASPLHRGLARPLRGEELWRAPGVAGYE